jgi:hypothetical protein
MAQKKDRQLHAQICKSSRLLFCNSDIEQKDTCLDKQDLGLDCDDHEQRGHEGERKV